MKQEAQKAIRFYAVATQGLFSMAALTVIGFFIGFAINKNSPWPAILAVVGLIFGLFTFITYLLYLLKQDEKDKKKEVLDAREEK